MCEFFLVMGWSGSGYREGGVMCPRGLGDDDFLKNYMNGCFVFRGLIKFLIAPLNYTSESTYILIFWSCATGVCGYSGVLCVSNGGERE